MSGEGEWVHEWGEEWVDNVEGELLNMEDCECVEGNLRVGACL